MLRLGFPLTLAAILLVGAVFTPPVIYQDRAEGLTEQQVRQLKDIAVASWDLQPLPLVMHLQVTDVDDPRSLGFPPTPEATVAWRTIFGVKFAETEVRHRTMNHRWRLGPAAAAWGAFLAVEAGLLGLAAWPLAGRLRRPPADELDGADGPARA